MLFWCFPVLLLLLLPRTTCLIWDKLVAVTLPARASCSDFTAQIDFALKRCVSIDHFWRQLPVFAPCPAGTSLGGRNCVGLVTSDFELACPLSHILNKDEICVRGETYSPPRVVCPPDYELIRARMGQDRVCIKRSFAKPIYQQIDFNTEVHCPEGFRLRKKGEDWPEETLIQEEGINPIEKTKKHRARDQSNHKHVCISHNIIPPATKDSCSTHFRWSIKVAGCLMLEARDPRKLYSKRILQQILPIEELCSAL